MSDGVAAMGLGTTSAAPLYIGTNNTAAITISTAQAVTCASTVTAGGKVLGTCTTAADLAGVLGLGQAFEVKQSTDSSGVDSFIAFHIVGRYAMNLGLDREKSALCVGGWSMGAVSHRVVHEGLTDASMAGAFKATDFYTSVAWTDYFASSTITGWAASPTGTIYYKRIGKTVVVSFYITGTSNAASAKFTLPVAAHASYPTFYTWSIRAVNNGTAQATPGMARLSPAGSTTLVECVLGWNSNPATGDFTTSGTKQIMGTLIYEAAS
jgi:hypothetical protein